MALSRAFNPSGLLLAAIAACMIKGMERIAPMNHFKYRSVEARRARMDTRDHASFAVTLPRKVKRWQRDPVFQLADQHPTHAYGGFLSPCHLDRA
jgi:organic hydroperoxide reductase OsmC/OhrA